MLNLELTFVNLSGEELALLYLESLPRRQYMLDVIPGRGTMLPLAPSLEMSHFLGAVIDSGEG